MLSAVKWVVYVFSYVYAVFGALVIADNTDLDFKSFLSEINGYIKGNIVKFLLLSLSFAGWFLLSMVTVGIALLWVLPYFFVTVSGFYDNVKHGAEDETEEDAGQEEEPEAEVEAEEEVKSETEDADCVTKDLSVTAEKVPSPDETVVFTKEMLEKIKNSRKND